MLKLFLAYDLKIQVRRKANICLDKLSKSNNLPLK